MDNYNATVYPENFNVTWSIGYMINTLKQNKTNPDQGVSWSLGDSFNLRLLMHYVGDIHQPLHTVSRYSQDFPDGDMGGNLFMLTEKEGINELHALWDSGIYEYDQDVSQPFNQTAWDYLGNISSNLREEHPIQEFTDALKVPEKLWAQEGYQIATSFLYKNIQ